MSLSIQLLAKLSFLDEKYPGWESLDNEHPEIIHLQKLYKLSETYTPRRQRTGPWTPQEIKFLERNIHSHTYRELANTLGRSFRGTRIKCQELGLSRDARGKYAMYQEDLKLVMTFETLDEASSHTRLNVGLLKYAIRTGELVDGHYWKEGRVDKSN